ACLPIAASPGTGRASPSTRRSARCAPRAPRRCASRSTAVRSAGGSRTRRCWGLCSRRSAGWWIAGRRDSTSRIRLRGPQRLEPHVERREQRGGEIARLGVGGAPPLLAVVGMEDTRPLGIETGDLAHARERIGAVAQPEMRESFAEDRIWQLAILDQASPVAALGHPALPDPPPPPPPQ